MDTSKRDVQISKALSYLLRHGASKEKLPIDSNGYISVQLVLAHNRLKTHKCTLDELHRIVDNNDKQRFRIKLSDGEELICATQGHSLKSVTPDEQTLIKIGSVEDLPDKLIHGTNLRNAVLIIESGYIKKMNRNHVHISPGITGVDAQVISGMRYSSNVYMFLHKDDRVLDELNIVKSLNGVILSPTDIPISLIEKIIIKKSNKTDAKELERLLTLLNYKNIPHEII